MNKQLQENLKQIKKYESDWKKHKDEKRKKIVEILRKHTDLCDKLIDKNFIANEILKVID